MKLNFESSSTAKIFYIKKLSFHIEVENIHHTFSLKNIPMLILNFLSYGV